MDGFPLLSIDSGSIIKIECFSSPRNELLAIISKRKGKQHLFSFPIYFGVKDQAFLSPQAVWKQLKLT